MFVLVYQCPKSASYHSIMTSRSHFCDKVFPHVIQIYTNLQNWQGYIFHVLQHFVTKLGNSTHSSMLVLTVVKDFVRFA